MTQAVQAPLPLQAKLPILIGGSGPKKTLRTTAKYGDAWYPIPNNPAFPMDSLKRLGAGIARLRQLTAEELKMRPSDLVKRELPGFALARMFFLKVVQHGSVEMLGRLSIPLNLQFGYR